MGPQRSASFVVNSMFPRWSACTRRMAAGIMLFGVCHGMMPREQSICFSLQAQYPFLFARSGYRTSSRVPSWKFRESAARVERPRTSSVGLRAQIEGKSDEPPAHCVRDATRKWMEEAVIGMNLCPWARAADQEGLVSITVCEAREEEEVLQQVSEAIERLLPEECFETALIVTPYTLQSFSDFMDMAAAIDDGALHASCTTEEDAENWTNRSPFPTFHLIQARGLLRRLSLTFFHSMFSHVLLAKVVKKRKVLSEDGLCAIAS
eukprot:3851162-Rhodomonas_salina.3